MAVFINLDFSAYHIPASGDGSEFADRIKSNNEQADAIGKLWRSYQEHEAGATKLLDQQGLKGITFYNVQERLAAAIDTAIKIIEAEHLLFDSVCKLLSEMAQREVITFRASHEQTKLIYDNHLVCANFATRIKSHLRKTLFCDLQIG